MKNNSIDLRSIKQKIEKYSSAIILTVIVLLAAYLRFSNLSSLPSSLHDDEVMNTYIGRFVLENGFDIQGNKFPLIYFNNFGDYPNVLPMYISGFFTFLFGVGAFGLRFPVALIGVFSVILIHHFSKYLFKSKKIMLLSALFLAITPWHIILSRATAEGITASFVFITAVFYLIKSIDNKKVTHLLLSVVLFFLTYFLYPGFRVLTALFLFPIFMFSNNKNWKKGLIGISACFLLLTLLISQTDWGKGRYLQTSLFSSDTIKSRSINYGLGFGENNILAARLFSNKHILSLREFLRQYSTYFSPQFLTGENNIYPQRYHLIEHGVVYWTLLALIFLTIGYQLFFPLPKKQMVSYFNPGKAKYAFLICWLMLIAPIPSAITLDEVPNIHRTVVMSFGWALIFGFCCQYLSESLLKGKRSIFVVCSITTLLFFEFVFFWQYFTNLFYESSFVWRPEEKKDLVLMILENQNNYDAFILPDNQALSLNYLFYKKDFSNQYIGKFGLKWRIETIDNLFFVEHSPGKMVEAAVSQLDDSKVLIVSNLDCSQFHSVLDDGYISVCKSMYRENLTHSYQLLELSKEKN